MSRRFAEGNKLLAPLGGQTVVTRTVQAYLDAELDPVLVVLGYQAREVAAALTALPITTVSNPEFEQGQSRALVHGVRALPAHARAAVIGVGDQPLLTGDIIHELVAAYCSSDSPLVVPRYGGQRGNPVLVDRGLFGELLEVEGDQGGRPVLERHRREIVWIDFPDARPGRDIDTLEDWREISRES